MNVGERQADELDECREAIHRLTAERDAAVDMVNKERARAERLAAELAQVQANYRAMTDRWLKSQQGRKF